MNHLVVIITIIILSLVANRVRSLSTSGALAAILVGTFIYMGFEEEGLIILGIFFSTSSFWSSYKKQQKKQLEEKLEKGSRRDWLQVFANGGVAAICSLLFYFTHDLLWGMAFLTTIASAMGDTWSSEIGPLSKRPPFSVKTFKVVEAGTSGAISSLGTMSAILGVGVITMMGILLLPITGEMAWIIFVFGILGNGIDTYLGAYVQRTYQCTKCSLEIEKSFHCGVKARKLGGLSLLNNDGVNFFSSLLAPVLAILAFQLIS